MELQAVDLELLRRSVELVVQRREEAVTHFYAHLFSSHPELRAAFPITEVHEHDRLLTALLHVLRNGHLMSAMAEDLHQVGRDHRKFDVIASHYTAVGEALLATGAAILGERWTAPVATAWRATYQAAAEIMFRAGAAVPPDDRRWWSAEVVSHERRTWGVAVIEAKVSEPLHFVPGQYVTIETPHWPRVWRPYSIANAPRADGRLEFHIRQIENGQSSWALVDAVHPGHVLKIGPPAGTLVLDHTRPRDLLLVAGGTGLAPLKALVEDVALHGGDGRRVCLFVGARTEEDLYDLDALGKLHREHEWLAIVPVVSDEPGYSGHRGLVMDAVAQYGPWTEFEAYVCGPPAMVDATRQRLREIGIPPRQIHHELWQAEIDESAVVTTAEVVRYAGPSTVVYGRRERSGPRHALGHAEPASQYSSSPYGPDSYGQHLAERYGDYSADYSADTYGDYTGNDHDQAPADQPLPDQYAPDQSPAGDESEPDAQERARRIREMIELKRARRSMYTRRR